MKQLVPMLTLALLVGCKGGESTPPPPPSQGFNLLLTDTEITLMQGQSKDITVTVKPENSFDGQVGFSLVQPSPNKLGSLFSPATTKTTTKLTLHAPLDLPANQYSLFIRGVSGDAKGVIELKVNVTKSPLVTVGGTVRNVIGGRVQGATVRIRGANNTESTDTSDASGQFTVNHVLPPYTATVKFPTGETHTFPNLTLPDPSLKLYTSNGVITATDVTISGTLSGGVGFPNPAGTVTQVVYASLLENLGIQGFLPGKGGPYTIKISQINEKLAEGQVFALQWQANLSGATSIPVSYKGFGASSKFISGGPTAAGKNITLTPVTQSVLSGTIDAPIPAGMTVLWKSLGAALVPRGGFVLAADHSNSTSFSYPIPTPEVLQNRFVLAVGARSSQGSSLILNRGNLGPAQTEHFTLKVPPYLASPADTATGAGNVLQWNRGTFQNPFFVACYRDSLSGANQCVYTTNTSYAAPLEKNMMYTWSLLAYDGFATPDDFVKPGVWSFGYPNAGSLLDFDFGLTKEQTFTTAP
ncbi:carboxypeptidase-like regulatory domain-containing protein [Deinococcus cellulosilyticus]|uniref:Carboxypeptidase regulatory-like domain-containing protein n=1 Tax=Deinococcus cellulosilyticus (strain DSM 18568 / NBRC 106333 / KACC 11606 / 5516J-15) TaxID=1223518 RepID=A0A511N271_DEIC1|nr:carboxypeptidase-like regulatory domain-containing protein [Deinococcus cellulosilyticus]GEM46511.1 hypothetical protein DC3_21460 [Deinococcus cellulosilyticus NBRC 106333 = KACC 11606]